LESPMIVLKPIEGENLYLYLVESNFAISAALVHEEERVQRSVYYISKRLVGVELRYLRLEKFAYYLLIASRKLMPYFQANPIQVLTNQPLR